jgi:hypothetical protein
MDDVARKTWTAADRAEQEAIQKTLKVSSYLDDVLESIHSGAPPKVNVPNYREPTKAELMSIPSEVYGEHMDLGGLEFKGSEQPIKTAAVPSLPAEPNKPRFVISRNQAMALKKYPTLIEFLGQSHGEKIAKQILQQMNVLVAEAVNKNSKEANECAVACKADKQNLKQYFQGEDWLCRVTASGPFRGDEAIFYSKDKDVACVLRKLNEDGTVKYTDVSSQFNLIYEAGEGNLVSASEQENVGEPVIKTASTEEQEGENNDEDAKLDDEVEVVAE